MLMISNKEETTVHCCDPALSVLVMFGVSKRFLRSITLTVFCLISTQHIATMLGPACCVRLVTLLRRVATCCGMLGVVGPYLKMAKFFMQHLWMLHDAVVV